MTPAPTAALWTPAPGCLTRTAHAASSAGVMVDLALTAVHLRQRLVQMPACLRIESLKVHAERQLNDNALEAKMLVQGLPYPAQRFEVVRGATGHSAANHE